MNGGTMFICRLCSVLGGRDSENGYQECRAWAIHRCTSGATSGSARRMEETIDLW